MRRILKSGSAITLVMALAVSGCGGSGSGSIGGGSAQAPTPEPTPTPTPTPSFPTVFRLESSLSMWGGAFFKAAEEYDMGDHYVTRIYSDSNGVIRPNAPDTWPISFFNQFTWKPEYSILTNGIDSVSGFQFGLYAPIGSSVVSPITDLLYKGKDSDRIMDGLQLSSGDFRLSFPVDIKNFSASEHFESSDPTKQQVARELVASNIRVIALTVVMVVVGGGPSNAPHRDELAPMFQFSTKNSSEIVQFLQSDSTAQLYTKSGNRAFLAWLNSNNQDKYETSTLDAMAHVISLYSSVIGRKINSRDEAARRMLGIQGWLAVQLVQLKYDNNAITANRALALTEADVMKAINAMEPLFPDMTAKLFPVPDFFRIRSDSEITLNSSYKGYSRGGADTTLWENDLYADRRAIGPNLDLVTSSVNVPESQQNALSVKLLADQSVQIRSLNGFKGVAWFNYNVKAPDNEERTGRVYMIVE